MPVPKFVKAALIRKLGYATFGWIANCTYSSILWLQWERKLTEMEKLASDWKNIFRASKNLPKNIYLSPGDLYVMAPILINTANDIECRSCIDKSCIKHIFPALVEHLNSANEFGPLIDSKLLARLDGNIELLRGVFGADWVQVSHWKRLPYFHGVVYGDYLHYCPWEVDHSGLLIHRTRTVFMNRVYDPDMFERLRKAITNDLE